MITKEELIKAWETISQFCEEQTCCDECPMMSKCDEYFPSKPLNRIAPKFINGIKESKKLIIKQKEYNTLLKIHDEMINFKQSLNNDCLNCPFDCEKECVHYALDYVIKQLKNYVIKEDENDEDSLN